MSIHADLEGFLNLEPLSKSSFVSDGLVLLDCVTLSVVHNPHPDKTNENCIKLFFSGKITYICI